ncbi:hypothetical protein O181_045229 [Austropuccinia psidii MF-1]|uniref:Uncharacterized protein n=1 Tax=Austropuccinia psidii MF-1 TaxID=1389203 RepID=A0A9Q3DLT0_9BASI|nr:hypothetical protein [Austropuccinia psidii MF-1]
MTLQTPYKIQTQSKNGRSAQEQYLSQLWFNTPLCNNCPKAKKKVYAIEQVPEEESPTEDSVSDSMGDDIREKSDDAQDPRDQFLLEYQEEIQIEIQEIQLEEGMPQDTANKNLCQRTLDAQKFLVTPKKEMEYIHGIAKKMTVCIDNSQQPLIIDGAAHCSIVARTI